MLRGEHRRTDHGYYMTRHPDRGGANVEQDMTWDKARKMESDFFDKPPWSNEEMAYRDRMGTTKLVKALSKQLCSMIETRFSTLAASC
jgi:hypothetical protein